MSIRLCCTFIFLCVILVSCQEKQLTNFNKKPLNIIWLVAEDQSAMFFSMYGDSTISLPYLEVLVEDAVRYTNAFAPVPVCAPSRSAIITGMYPTSLGTHNMRTYNRYSAGNEIVLGIPSYSPVVPQGVKAFTEYLRSSGYYCTNNSKEDYNFKIPDEAWDDSSNGAHWRNGPEDVPIFSVFNFGVCHESGIWKYSDSTLFVSPDLVPVPPYFPDTDSIRHDLAVNYSNLKRLDDQLGQVINELKEDGLYENSLIFFYSDHGGPFPRHKRALQDSGTRVPLLIKFPYQENAGQSRDDMVSFIDFAPTILSVVGIKPPEVMQGKAFIGPYKSKERRTHIYTSSDRFDEVVDRQRAVRTSRFKYIRNFMPELAHALPISYRENIPMMREMIRMQNEGLLNSAQQQWFNAPKATEELYDLYNDPHELINLAGNSDFQDTLMQLRQKLDQWILETNDLGEIPEKELLNRWAPKGVQPQLQPPGYEITDSGISLKSEVTDATLLWRVKDDAPWQFYGNPLEGLESLQAKAVRIGFTDSAILKVNLP